MKKLFWIIPVLLVVAGAVLLSISRKAKVADIVDDEYNEDIRSCLGGEVDAFKTDKGNTLYIFSIKHATIAMRLGAKWIYIDPVTSAAMPETDFSDLPKADYILFTHDHYDHFDTTAICQLKADNTVIIANPDAAAVVEGAKAMSNGETFTTPEGWTIDAVPAYNNSEEKLQFHPKGRDNGYILTIEGLRIYIAGDTEVIPELSEIKDIDVAFLPCNLPYTMTPEQCAEAARIVKPAVLFPYHYSDTDLSGLAALLDGTGIDLRIRSYK